MFFMGKHNSKTAYTVTTVVIDGRTTNEITGGLGSPPEVEVFSLCCSAKITAITLSRSPMATGPLFFSFHAFPVQPLHLQILPF